MRKDYQQSEDRAVEDFAAYGAEKVPYSGAKVDDKLDVKLTEGKLSNYLISNKHTSKGSFSVNQKDWEKDTRQSISMGSKLFRRVEMEHPVTGTLEKYIIINQDLFLELLAANEETQEED